ncbi:hypothetical protein CFP56_008094 [Quercus suber]|uniref:Transposase n=1 Tax=Quercus suber TaxID=58331 RepID=A0AAW0L639_QUESU
MLCFKSTKMTHMTGYSGLIERAMAQNISGYWMMMGLLHQGKLLAHKISI